MVIIFTESRGRSGLEKKVPCEHLINHTSEWPNVSSCRIRNSDDCFRGSILSRLNFTSKVMESPAPVTHIANWESHILIKHRSSLLLSWRLRRHWVQQRIKLYLILVLLCQKLLLFRLYDFHLILEILKFLHMFLNFKTIKLMLLKWTCNNCQSRHRWWFRLYKLWFQRFYLLLNPLLLGINYLFLLFLFFLFLLNNFTPLLLLLLLLSKLLLEILLLLLGKSFHV